MPRGRGPAPYDRARPGVAVYYGLNIGALPGDEWYPDGVGSP
jgi:hypothetical protein